MASESTIPEQLRASLFPILIGLMEPTPGSDPDRVVLVNPVTQDMVVISGNAAAISEIISSGGGEVGGGAPPASKASIEAMRSVEPSEVESEEECSMCLDAMKKEEEEIASVKEMPCRHRFHGDCIEKWLKMHGSCPVCRYQMPIEEEERGGEKRRGRRESEVWITIAFRMRERDGDDDADPEGDEDREE